MRMCMHCHEGLAYQALHVTHALLVLAEAGVSRHLQLAAKVIHEAVLLQAQVLHMTHIQVTLQLQ